MRLSAVSAIIASVLLLGICGQAQAQAIGKPDEACTSAPFASLLPTLLLHAPTAAAPVTMILPADGSARLNIRQPIGTDADPRIYRVFEHDGRNEATNAGQEDPVVAVDPAAANPDNLFKPTDSTALRVIVPPGFPWLNRTFVIVACKGAQIAAWGSVTAPVSNPNVVLAICVAAGLLTYLLGMAAVFIQRRKPHALEVKYPAIFSARPLTKWDFWNPIHLMADQFHRGSVQKAQVLLFSFLVGELVLSMALRTGALVNMSGTVVALLGISGIGAAASQIAYQQRTRLSFENWAWLEGRNVLKTPSPADSGGPYWRDLVISNREFDVYKLQTIIFTLAVAAGLAVDGASNLASFTIPEALLGILGLSQVVYVGGVMVKPPAVSDLDNALTKLRQAQTTYDTAMSSKTDVDADGKPLGTPLPPGAIIAHNAWRQYEDLVKNIVIMIESALEVPADRSKLDLPEPIEAIPKPEDPSKSEPVTTPVTSSAGPPQTATEPPQ